MVNNNLYLGPGNTSLESNLGAYYQNLKPAIYHFENDSLGSIDKDGIPFLWIEDKPYYSVVYIIQYGLILHDIYLETHDEVNLVKFKKCLTWLDEKAETYKDSLVWRNERNIQYGLEKGWISGMYQGQAISLYLRAYQLFDEETFLKKAKDIYNFLKYDYSEGGIKRVDSNGNHWYEEYPTDPPSFVLNGFIYTIFGVLDLYRVTNNIEVKENYDACIKSLKENIHKYHRWYWSLYDQGKKQLVSYYYQKNIHIPLMSILYELTKEEIFIFYEKKWSKQLNKPLNLLIVQLMYRIQPRLKKLLK